MDVCGGVDTYVVIEREEENSTLSSISVRAELRK